MPPLVRACYHTPILDRWAYQWMWMHGGWDVEPWEPPEPPPKLRRKGAPPAQACTRFHASPQESLTAR